MDRYKSQVAIPEIGLEGQKKILEASVLIIGLGGLGCPIALQLAAAGVGTIGLVENDIIDYTNLPRQILYTENDINKSKIDIASNYLQSINSETKIIKHSCFLNENNYHNILNHYDIIIDASDNFITRYVINDACYLMKKYLISGMVFRFMGRLIEFDFLKKDTPCLRCLYPNFSCEVESCSEGGIINSVTGMIGSMIVNQTIKKIIDFKNQINDTLLMQFDCLQNTMQKIKLSQDQNCQLCGKNKTIFSVKSMNNKNINNDIECSVDYLSKRRQENANLIILDVRNPDEIERNGKISNSINIPLSSLESECINKLKNKNAEIIVHCHAGVRSLSASKILKDQGFTNVKSLSGGILRYKNEIKDE